MKHLLIPVIFLLSGLSSYAQENVAVGLEKPFIRKFIDQHFCNLFSPASKHIIGNFASLDLLEPEIKLAGNTVFNNGSILAIRVKGGSDDGLIPLFSNSKLNTKYGFDAQFNFLDFRKKTITYENKSYSEFIKQQEKIHQEYKNKLIEIKNEKQKNELNLDLVETENEILRKENAIKDIIKRIEKASGLTKDSLTLQKKKSENELEVHTSELEFKKEQYKSFPSKNTLSLESFKIRENELKQARSELKVDEFKIGWFSIGYGISNHVFRLFNLYLPSDRTVVRNNFVAHSINLNYNFFKFSPVSYQSLFVSTGIAFSVEDNFSSLTKAEINETKHYTSDPDDFMIINQYNIYQGFYKKNLQTITLNADFLYFLFENDKGALHFFPEHKTAKGIEPVTNLGFGFLLAFKNNNLTANKLNAEIYADLFDIANNRNSVEKLLSRSSYGLRFTFPINSN